MNNLILAQIVAGGAGILNIIAPQRKERKNMFLLFALGNAFYVVNFLLLGAYSGAGIQTVYVIQALISMWYAMKNKEYTWRLITLYFILGISGGLLTLKAYIDILPLMGAISYILAIIQKEENKVRIFTGCTASIWTVYNLLVGAYVAAAFSGVLIISTVIAFIRYNKGKIINKKESI